MKGAYILVIDDEQPVLDMIEYSLKSAGFKVGLALNASIARDMIDRETPDLLLLDWMMPGLDGVEFARRLRRDEISKSLPIIMLSARIEEDDRVSGLDAGVDDYIVKPFSPRELIARVRAVLRRTNPEGLKAPLKEGDVELDPVSHRVQMAGESVDLGPTEYSLLKYLLSNVDRVLSRGQLLDGAWGRDSEVEDRTVDVHIMRLRKILKQHGLARYVQTVRGSGYRFSSHN